MPSIYLIVIAVLLLVNIITFVIYAIDKYKAKHNKWRVSEATLLIMAAIGGSIGALLAMQLLRHKTQHPQFYIGVPTIIIIQIALTVYFLFF